MGTTVTNALPYPEPTDPVAQGAAAIRALAEAVDTKMQPATPPFYVATGGNDALPTGLTNITWPNLAGDAFNYDAANKRFICVKPGQYVLTGRIVAAVGTVADVRLYIGPSGFNYVVPTTAGQGTVTVVRTLNLNDTVAVQVNNPGVATTTVAGSTRFEAVRAKF